MKRPSTRTMILGHPVVATPLIFTGGSGLFASLYCGDGNGRIVPAAICLAVALTTLRANEAASKYRTWQAEWEAMAPESGPRTGKLRTFIGILLSFGLVVGGLYVVRHADAYSIGYVLGRAVALSPILLPLLAIVALVRWLRRRPRRAGRSVTVKVVARTVLRVPSLDAAYAALPDYCQRLLDNGR